MYLKEISAPKSCESHTKHGWYRSPFNRKNTSPLQVPNILSGSGFFSKTKTNSLHWKRVSNYSSSSLKRERAKTAKSHLFFWDFWAQKYMQKIKTSTRHWLFFSRVHSVRCMHAVIMKFTNIKVGIWKKSKVLGLRCQNARP